MHANVTLDPTTIESQIANLAAQGQRQIESQRAIAEHAAASRVERERNELAVKWQPTLETIYAALPDWMHPYLEQPTAEPTWHSHHEYDYGLHYRPVVLSLLDCGPIHIYTVDNRVGYTVPEPRLRRGEGIGDDDHGWYAYFHDDGFDSYGRIGNLQDSLAIAVCEAAKTHEAMIELTLEADRRNQQAESKPSAVAADPLDQAKRQLAHAEQMDGECAGPALQWVQTYAAVAQAEALKRIAAVLEATFAVGGTDYSGAEMRVLNVNTLH